MTRLRSAQPVNSRSGRHPAYEGDWRRLAARAVADHVALNGMVCPGWNRPAHPVSGFGGEKLTGDHRVPKALGGTAADGIDVLCQSCNTHRGHETQRQLAGQEQQQEQRSQPPRSIGQGSVRDDPTGGWFA